MSSDFMKLSWIKVWKYVYYKSNINSKGADMHQAQRNIIQRKRQDAEQCIYVPICIKEREMHMK